MTDSDPELKTYDDTPPPQGRTRSSMDETDQDEKENEDQQLTQLQNSTAASLQPQGSSSPRPPPTDPPPPVPPSKPTNKHINDASYNTLVSLEELDKNSKPNKPRLRRRRASLPSINIFPSFKSLKSVMGFEVDEDDKDKDKDKDKDEKNNQDNKPNGKHNKSNMKHKKRNDKNNEKSVKNDKNDKQLKQNDKNKTLNKKLNPKEIKQLYIKNLKLQAQIDKYKEREKEFEYKSQEMQFKLQEQTELVFELKNQVNAKSEVVRSLDEQLSKHNNTMSHNQQLAHQSDTLRKKLIELERLLVEKDTTIQTLQQSMLKIEKNSNTLSANYTHKSGNLSPSPEPLSKDKNDNVHKRSLTPGGYALDSMPWDTQNDMDYKSNPSAPPIDNEFLDDRVHGLSLNQKLDQRPSWKDLQSRGILLDDPTTKKSQSLQAAHRTLHKRKASQTVDKLLNNRPDRKKLHDTNILKNIELEEDENEEQKIPFGIKVDNGLNLNQRIQQRPSWMELNSRGILLDDPTTQKSQSLQAAQRQLHKRKASQNIDKLLINRPTPNDLHAQNIIDATTAALFFGASPTTQVVTPRTDYSDEHYTSMMNATDSLFAASQPVNNEYKSHAHDIIYKDNMDRSTITEKLERNIAQRPSIDETMARGILMFRTDTKLNYDLQQRHKQLHKRKASQSLEKLMMKRPQSHQLEQKGILIKNPSQQQKHKRKTSQDLEAGLKKRMSLSEMQGLGLLFSDKGYEFENISESDETEQFITDNEQHQQIAALFKQKPRTSKPLHETDFKGIEFEDYNERKAADTNTNNNNNKRRGSVDNAFEPYKLSKKKRISRIGSKLKQRPSVEDMRMRGLLYEHPSISKSLVERKRDLMKRRASNKVESLLVSRPHRKELVDRNILLAEDETLEKRKRHKRKRSQNLEHAIMRRPKLMEEQEAQRQRKRSMTDSDFTPEYMQHILNDEEENEYNNDMQTIEIRFLNIGGFVLPLVSPKFMSDLMGGGGGDEMGMAMGMGGNNMIEDMNMNMNMNMDMNNNMNMMESGGNMYEQEMEELRDELDDLKMTMQQQERQLAQKDARITSLKGENSSLKQNFSRKSLVDINLNHLNTFNMKHNNNNNIKDEQKDQKEMLKKLRKENESQSSYIEQLSYYMREEKDIIIPTQRELKTKKLIKNKLRNHFKQRPSFMDLQEKQILSSNFINDVTNQNAQIAERKLKFRRTSQLISNFLAARPSKDSLEQYFKDSVDYNEYIAASETQEVRFDIVDNATKNELREEVGRLNDKLAEKINTTNKLEKENETMRFKIQQNLNDNAETLGRGLKEHSIYESKLLNQAINDWHKESEENQMITELKGENENLKQKIRRLSTVDNVAMDHMDVHSDMSEMKQFINWMRDLVWPDIICSMFNENENENDLLFMQRVINEMRQLTENVEIQSQNSENRIVELERELERQKKEHLKDKEKFVLRTMQEMDRLRAEIKNVGREQQIIIHKTKKNIQNINNNNNNNSYLSSATSYFWNSKK